MKGAVKTALKVGRIRYINTLPFFHRLDGDNAAVNYYESYPSRVKLNPWLLLTMSM